MNKANRDYLCGAASPAAGFTSPLSIMLADAAAQITRDQATTIYGAEIPGLARITAIETSLASITQYSASAVAPVVVLECTRRKYAADEESERVACFRAVKWSNSGATAFGIVDGIVIPYASLFENFDAAGASGVMYEPGAVRIPVDVVARDFKVEAIRHRGYSGSIAVALMGSIRIHFERLGQADVDRVCGKGCR